MQEMAPPVAPPSGPSAQAADIVSALVHLGYSRPEAERAVERAIREHGEGRFEDLLRFALQVVSRR
jgi:Holliday junction resolvasome RuvABC DNA-binding subunit